MTKLTEQQLRAAIRAEIKNALKEATAKTVQKKFKDLEIGDEYFPNATKPGQVGGQVFKKIKSDRAEMIKLSNRPSNPQFPDKGFKVGEKQLVNPEKLVWVLTNENALKEAEGTAPKPLKLKGGLSRQQLGGSSAMKFAEPFIEALKELDGIKQAKALAYVLASIGVDVDTLQKRLGTIKTTLQKYSN